MPGFNFLFEAFILLMGLAMAEVLRGFARVLKLRTRRKAGIDLVASSVRVGWLTPLLGLLVILDQSTFFLHMYGFRDYLVFNSLSVIGILLLIGWYYLVASLTFPDEPADWPDFDKWYFQQKRWVAGGVLGINIVSIAISAIIIPMERQREFAEALSPTMLAINSIVLFVFFPSLVWLIFSKRPRVDIVLLALMIFITLLFAVVTGGEPAPG